MRKLSAALLLFALLAVSQAVLAQETIRAKSEAGKDVILYPDGTWKYVEAAATSSSGSTHNKPATAKKLYKPTRGHFGIWYDDKKWRDKGGEDPDERLRFSLIGGDAYIMIVVEELAVPIESLKIAALINAKTAAPDAKITKEEMRTVNGKKVLALVIEGTVKEIPFTYYGYYYGDKDGAIQVVGFTGQSIFAKYEAEFTKFLNGLEIY